MRNFFHSHWKVIVALVLLILVAALTVRPNSANAAPDLAERLRQHVRAVASEEHNTGTPARLERAAVYIETELERAGYTPARQEYTAGGQRVRNIEVAVANVAPGKRPERIFIVGAHYDSAPGAPGANDNGSGTAAVLELARLLKTMQPGPGTEVRFVFFVNEEPPWFMGADMGSMRHAAGLKRQGQKVAGALVLETMGYYTDAPNTQQLPAGLEGATPRPAISLRLWARWSHRSWCARRWRPSAPRPIFRPTGWRRRRIRPASRCPTMRRITATAIRR